MAKKPSQAIQYPELEVVVRAGAIEIACVAFFRDDYGGWDVLVGVEDIDNRHALADTLRNSAAAVEGAEFVHPRPDDSEGGLPF